MSEKPFACPICNRRFSTMEEMERNREGCVRVVAIIQQSQRDLRGALLSTICPNIPYDRFDFQSQTEVAQESGTRKVSSHYGYKSGELELNITLVMPVQPKPE